MTKSQTKQNGRCWVCGPHDVIAIAPEVKRRVSVSVGVVRLMWTASGRRTVIASGLRRMRRM